MGNNRLLITAILLITLGLTGAFLSTSFGIRHWPGRRNPMMNMMTNGGMIWRGMMNRDQMRDMMQQMMPGMLPPPGINPENLPDPNSNGAKLLNRYCSQCHYLASPAMHAAEEWPLVASRMFSRMSMMSGMGGMGMGMMNVENPSPGEQREIVSYLKTHAMKSISPEALPSTGSKEARLFKEVCSQCHSLPDPGLHTAVEWPAVIERMQDNMKSMDRKTNTDQEKKAIAAYLSAHARK